MVFFLILFNSFSTRKIEKKNDFFDSNNSITLNIKRAVRVKSINLDIVRKLIKYSLKTVA